MTDLRPTALVLALLLACGEDPPATTDAPGSSSGTTASTATTTATGGHSSTGAPEPTTSTTATDPTTTTPTGTSTTTDPVATTDPATTSSGTDSSSTSTTDPGPSPCGPPCRETFVHEGNAILSLNDDLSAFTCVTRINGDLHFGGDIDDAALSAFANLEIVEGSFQLQLNDLVTNLDGFACLREVASVRLNKLPALTDISGLSNLRVAPYLTMQETGVVALPSLPPDFEGLQDLRIWNNPALTDISEIAGWSLHPLSPYGGVEISSNPALTSIVGLGDLLAAATGTPMLTLRDLPALTSLAGLETATHGNFALVDLPLVPDLLPLSAFATTEPSVLWLSGMPLVTSLDGLNDAAALTTLNLGACPQGQTAKGMDGLTSLAGLDNVTTLDLFQIAGNANLASLAGATSLTSVAYLTVIANPKLEPAAHAEFLAQLVDPPPHCFGDWDICVCPDFMP